MKKHRPSLSHNLTPLFTGGTAIVDAGSGMPVLLRGVNRSGLEYSSPDGPGSLAKAGVTEAEMDELVGGWRANIIRVPFNQDWALRRDGYDPEPYLEAIDAVIEMAARRGAYTLLDLQWLDAVTPRGSTNTGAINFVPPLPDGNTVTLWTQLAERYAGEPAVLYDIFNEPHDVLPGDPVPLLGVTADGQTYSLESRRVTVREWQPWVVVIVSAIRSQNERALIFVPGTDWGYDLRGYPIDEFDGLVYSTHVYRGKGLNWNEAFGELSTYAPVFAGEWGGGEGDLEWGRDLAQYLSERGIGWTAWSWSDRPRLVEASEGVFLPTRFGELVRDWMIGPLSDRRVC
jgi:hypothetical protein